MSNIHFSTDDLSLLSNADILRRKKQIQDKLYYLLDFVRQDITSSIKSNSISLEGKYFNEPKISRGENYSELPYLVLDYPSKFEEDNIFACRTMFLWGCFFSSTIHLQGQYLDRNRQQIKTIAQKLIGTPVYISCGESPWKYSYEPDNYLPLTETSIDQINRNSFIKISQKIELDDYSKVREIASKFYLPFLEELSY